MMRSFLVICILASASAGYLKAYRGNKEALLALIGVLSDGETADDEKIDDDSCDYLREDSEGDGGPSPIEVNNCIDRERTESCDYFDVSQCENQECLLGYQTDRWGCVVSCQCATEGLLEGDIRVDRDDKADIEALYGMSVDPFPRAASKFKKRWNNIPSGDGTYAIPYVFSETIKNRPNAVNAIYRAFAAYSEQTCLRFVERTDEQSYIKFIDGGGCYSYVGRLGGAQPVSIGSYCAYQGTVMHELMHAMGFWHEQSRPDRDGYVRILTENIKPNRMNNFRKMNSNWVDSMGSPYDIGSIMHYGGYFFSRNRKPTIVRIDNGRPVRAQRTGFSREDAKQINLMYGCEQ